MSRRAGAALAGMALAAAAGAAPRDAAPEVSTRVSTVLTSAHCEAPGFAGLCRVIVADEGFEHVQSRVWIEWLSPRERGAPVRLRRMAVHDVGSWVLAPAPRGIDGRRVHFDATHTYSMERRARVLEFGPPGHYRWIGGP